MLALDGVACTSQDALSSSPVQSKYCTRTRSSRRRVPVCACPRAKHIHQTGTSKTPSEHTQIPFPIVFSSCLLRPSRFSSFFNSAHTHTVVLHLAQRPAMSGELIDLELYHSTRTVPLPARQLNIAKSPRRRRASARCLRGSCLRVSSSTSTNCPLPEARGIGCWI